MTTLLREVDCFNSIVVRLKVRDVVCFKHSTDKFQFHSGSIKRMPN